MWLVGLGRWGQEQIARHAGALTNQIQLFQKKRKKKEWFRGKEQALTCSGHACSGAEGTWTHTMVKSVRLGTCWGVRTRTNKTNSGSSIDPENVNNDVFIKTGMRHSSIFKLLVSGNIGHVDQVSQDGQVRHVSHINQFCFRGFPILRQYCNLLCGRASVLLCVNLFRRKRSRLT